LRPGRGQPFSLRQPGQQPGLFILFSQPRCISAEHDTALSI
jgi:hypothetical protein